MKNQSSNIPMRKCIGCGKSFPKSELIRIAGKSGDLAIDMEDKKEGRGIYLCRNTECIGIAEKKRAINRAFRTEIPKELSKGLFESAREFCNEK